MKDKIFYLLISAFLAGIIFSSFLNINFHTCMFFGLIAAVFLSSYFLLRRKEVLLIALCIILFAIACFRVHVKNVSQQENILDNFVEENVEITGLVYEEVEHRQSSQRILIKAESLKYLGKDYPIKQNILVSSELYPKIKYGDVLSVSGRLDKPENFITDTGKEFNYKNYLKKESIYYTMSFVKIEVIGKDQGAF